LEGHVVEHDFPAIGRRTIALNARRLRQAGGKEEMILLSMEDFTEAARAEAVRRELLESAQTAARDAEAAGRLKDEFVAVASHELRGPLNAMVGWIHLLSGGALDPATAARALRVIDRNVKMQARLINELLDMTRLMAGKLRLSVRQVELLPIVEAAMETARPAAETKGVTMRLAEGTTAELVQGDADRLQQVVWNLLSNAVKFTPQGGSIDVWTGRSGTHVQVRVTDTGQGISADFLPHVFERFRQADSSPARQQSGLGLGLAITQELVELHGGTVTAESPGQGKGSAFVVSLPLPALRLEPAGAEKDAEGEEAPAPKPWTAPDPSLLHGLRVLVVEDEADGRDLIQTVLESCGAEVTAVASAAAALAAFDREPPQLVVSDIGLPGQDGYALIREIRRRPPEAGGLVPAMALTAFAAAEDRQRTAAAGYQAYLAKPADPTMLVAKVALLAGSSERS
jgi:signal transduction histidine kinase/ActR/RegA family two-component response regulator